MQKKKKRMNARQGKESFFATEGASLLMTPFSCSGRVAALVAHQIRRSPTTRLHPITKTIKLAALDLSFDQIYLLLGVRHLHKPLV